MGSILQKAVLGYLEMELHDKNNVDFNNKNYYVLTLHAHLNALMPHWRTPRMTRIHGLSYSTISRFIC